MDLSGIQNPEKFVHEQVQVGLKKIQHRAAKKDLSKDEIVLKSEDNGMETLTLALHEQVMKRAIQC